MDRRETVRNGSLPHQHIFPQIFSFFFLLFSPRLEPTKATAGRQALTRMDSYDNINVYMMSREKKTLKGRLQKKKKTQSF